MTTSLDAVKEQLNGLQKKQAEAEQRKHQAKAALDVEARNYKSAMDDLKALGFDSVEAAQAEVARLTAEVTSLLSAADAVLNGTSQESAE